MTVAAVVGAPLVDEMSTRGPDLVAAGDSRTWSVCGRNFLVLGAHALVKGARGTAPGSRR